jgi:hypothetical protein
MPTPVELITDPVSLCVFALYGALVCWEALAPARRLPAVKGWRLRGLFAFMFISFFHRICRSHGPSTWRACGSST